MADERCFWDSIDIGVLSGDNILDKQPDDVDQLVHDIMQRCDEARKRDAHGGVIMHHSSLSSVSSIQSPDEESFAPVDIKQEAVASKKYKSCDDQSLKHKCDICSQVFDSKIALSIHTGRIHKHEGRDKSYQCKLCSKAFFNSSYLAQHMRIHTGVKPYGCTQCDKKFTQLSHLQQHKRTHTGEKPYRCPQPGCTKAFSQLSNLQSHSRSHLPEGNVHKCSSCYKCYFDETSLVVHMKTHLEAKRVRNYKCDHCGKSYTQDTYLQNHINTKHAGAVDNNINPASNRHPTSIQAANNMVCKLEDGAEVCEQDTRTGMMMPADRKMPYSGLERAHPYALPFFPQSTGYYPAGGPLPSFGSTLSSRYQPAFPQQYKGPAYPDGSRDAPTASAQPSSNNTDYKQSTDDSENFWRGIKSTISNDEQTQYSSAHPTSFNQPSTGRHNTTNNYPAFPSATYLSQLESALQCEKMSSMTSMSMFGDAHADYMSMGYERC